MIDFIRHSINFHLLGTHKCHTRSEVYLILLMMMRNVPHACLKALHKPIQLWQRSERNVKTAKKPQSTININKENYLRWLNDRTLSLSFITTLCGIIRTTMKNQHKKVSFMSWSSVFEWRWKAFMTKWSNKIWHKSDFLLLCVVETINCLLLRVDIAFVVDSFVTATHRKT